MINYNVDEIAAQAIERGEDALHSVVGQAIGAASVCWDPMDGTGVFQSEDAVFIVNSLIAWIKKYGFEENWKLKHDEYVRITALEASSRSGPDNWLINETTTQLYLDRAKAFESYIRGE